MDLTDVASQLTAGRTYGRRELSQAIKEGSTLMPREADCLRKLRFPTLTSARFKAKAEWKRRRMRFDVYRCKWCKMFHLMSR
jgi:hypothetical protein